MSPTSSPKLKLVFLHIPKTAGTSVHSKFITKFDKSEICPERFRGLRKYPKEDLEKFSYFSGHFTMPMAEYIPGEKFIFTILRDPKERIISLYYFWRRHKDDFARSHNLLGPISARSMPLTEFLRAQKEPPRDAIKNTIARTLAGGILADEFDRYFEVIENKRRYISKYEIIRRAIGAINRINYVGFVDSINEDMDFLFRSMGFEGETSLQRQNTRHDVSPNFDPVVDQGVTEEDERLLDNLTDLDRIVYDVAKLKRDSVFSALST